MLLYSNIYPPWLLKALMERLRELNPELSSAIYLPERKGNDHVTITPGRILFKSHVVQRTAFY